jgi:hypothetical protein
VAARLAARITFVPIFTLELLDMPDSFQEQADAFARRLAGGPPASPPSFPSVRPDPIQSQAEAFAQRLQLGPAPVLSPPAEDLDEGIDGENVAENSLTDMLDSEIDRRQTEDAVNQRQLPRGGTGRLADEVDAAPGPQRGDEDAERKAWHKAENEDEDRDQSGQQTLDSNDYAVKASGESGVTRDGTPFDVRPTGYESPDGQPLFGAYIADRQNPIATDVDEDNVVRLASNLRVGSVQMKARR